MSLEIARNVTRNRNLISWRKEEDNREQDKPGQSKEREREREREREYALFRGDLFGDSFFLRSMLFLLAEKEAFFGCHGNEG